MHRSIDEIIEENCLDISNHEHVDSDEDEEDEDSHAYRFYTENGGDCGKQFETLYKKFHTFQQVNLKKMPNWQFQMAMQTC